MFQIQAPILIVPTADASLALGVHLHAAGLAGYREIALAAKGLEIAHLQFVFRGLTLALCSRVRCDGIVEIEMGLGDPRLPSSFTAAQMRQAEAAARARISLTKMQRSWTWGIWLPAYSPLVFVLLDAPLDPLGGGLRQLPQNLPHCRRRANDSG